MYTCAYKRVWFYAYVRGYTYAAVGEMYEYMCKITQKYISNLLFFPKLLQFNECFYKYV